MTPEERWVEATMIAMTDQLIDSRYGPIRFPVEVLRRFADQLNQDSGPMVVNHDETNVMRVRNQRAIVERDDDLHWRIRVDAEVHPDDWGAWKAHRQEVGALGGMSVAVTVPIRKATVSDGILILGDAADFADEELLALADAAPDPTVVRCERLYQFAADPEPVRLIIEFTTAVIHGVPVSMLSDWLTRVIDTVRERADQRRSHRSSTSTTASLRTAKSSLVHNWGGSTRPTLR